MSPKRPKLPAKAPESSSRKPKAAHEPQDSRAPRTSRQPDPSSLGEKPVWQFRHVDLEGPWGWALVKPCDVADVLSKLRDFEGMRWSEICHAKKQHHSCEVDTLCPRAKRRLLDLGLDDEDALFRFRLTGTQRLWGVRRGAAFFILWWDPDHEVCPSVLKHT